MDEKDSERNAKWNQPFGVRKERNGHSWIAWRGFALFVVAFLVFWYEAPLAGWISGRQERPQLCQPIESTRNLQFNYRDLDHFAFLEKFEHDEARTFNGRFIGTLQLLPAHEGQSSDITVDVSISATDSVLSESVQTEVTESSLKVNLPRYWARGVICDSCLKVDVSIFVRPGLVLEDLLLDLDASRVTIPSIIDLAVNTTKINLHAGGLDATPFFTSRETRIDLNAGSVIGEYSLFDLLHIQTHAGSVTVNVMPQEADVEKPVPAVLIIGSDAGSVHAAYPPLGTNIPKREYCTTVWSHQGAINGNYIHGLKTTLESNAGSITADILPYAANDYKSTLRTRTDAGAQRINVLSPFTDAGTKIGGLTSSHLTHAASLTIEYPPEWEGLIEGRTRVGALTLRGHVRVIKEGGVGLVGGYVLAEKGDGDCGMQFRTAAGSAFVEMK